MAQRSKITAVLTENGIRCQDANGATVIAGGPGPRAGDLLLMAVAGCSGATLKAIMAKEGWTPSAMDITVEGIVSEDRPRRYTEIDVHFGIECGGLPQDKAESFVKATGELCFVTQSVSAKKHLTFTLRG